MKEIALIFVGSGFGGVVRFALGKYISTLSKLNFPSGTFIVNIIACLVLGVVAGLAMQKQWLTPLLRSFLIIGFCGGFSTFSSFSYETLMLFKQGHYTTALFYVTVSVVACFAAVGAGLYAGSKLM